MMVLTGIRLSMPMLDELKELAVVESKRRGETVTWAMLVREGAERTLRQAKRRAKADRALPTVEAAG